MADNQKADEITKTETTKKKVKAGEVKAAEPATEVVSPPAAQVRVVLPPGH